MDPLIVPGRAAGDKSFRRSRRADIAFGIVQDQRSMGGIALMANFLFKYTWICTICLAERQIYRELLRILAPGEAACIACAKGRGGVVATDDRVARNCCLERGIRFTGTLGILKACCVDRTLSPEAADTLLLAMIKAGYHFPVHRISDGIG